MKTKNNILDKFIYNNLIELSYNRERQTIIYRGKEIGYFVSIIKNWFVPTEEIYLLPDIDYGLQKGWIDFKRFNNYDEAFEYAKQNFDKLVYLFENGDYD